MSSKGIVAIKDETICMKCLKKKATHTYYISYRGYGSLFDMMETKFQCCDDCNKPEYDEWFNEKEVMDDYIETYQHEDEILNLIHGLPLESQELFENRFDDKAYKMDPQDWIDFELDELPHEKCKEYYLHSPKDVEAYNTKFTTCEHVVNVVWDDNSKNSRCPFGAYGDYNQKVDECGNICDECTDCEFYKRRGNSIEEIKSKDYPRWELKKKYELQN